MMPFIQNSKDPVQSLLRPSLERAAFIEHFDPVSLLGIDTKDEHWPAALRCLSAFCTEVLTNEGFRWTLLPDARTKILQSLESSKKIELAQDLQRSGDTLAQDFAAVILDDLSATEELSTTRLQRLRRAALYLGDAVDSALVRKFDRALEQNAFRSELEQARSEHFVGRSHQLNRLSQLIDEAPAPHTHFTWLQLTGPGGSGKSALLAEFVIRYRNRARRNSPVVLLDFDRTSLIQADSFALTLELARQLGLAVPEWADAMYKFRMSANSSFTNHNTVNSTEYHEASARAKGLSGLWLQYTESLPPLGPILLILDTLEEIAVQTSDVAQSLQDWLLNLRNDLGLSDIRIIFAGRAVPDIAILTGDQSPKSVVLGDLQKEDAHRMLRYLLQASPATTRDCDRLINRFGCNPLMLRLLAGWINTNGRYAIEDLTAPAFAHDRNNAVVQGMLYRRILSRIRAEDDVKRLACPGLVLRRVTPELIRQVLAQPCGLEAIDAGRARNLFEVLGRQVWLVQRGQNNELIHRKDLRQLMLKLLMDHDPDVTSVIHATAEAFYNERQDGSLTPSQQAVEAQYHRLMQGTLEELDLAAATRLLQSVGLDIDCAPPGTVAKLKAQADWRLSSTDKALLDTQTLERYQRRTETRLYRRNNLTHLSEVIPVTDLGPLRYSTAPVPNDVLAAFAQAQLHEVADMAPALFSNTLNQRHHGATATEGRHLVESSLWKAALCSLAVGSGDALAAHIIERMAVLGATKKFDERFNPDGSARMTFRNAIEVILCLLGCPLPPEIARQSVFFLDSSIISVDHYRHLQLNKGAQGIFQTTIVSLRAGLMRFLSPDFLTFLTNTEDTQRSMEMRRLPLIARTSHMFKEGDLNLAVLQKMAASDVTIAESMKESRPDNVLSQCCVSDLYPALCPALENIDLDHLCEVVDALSADQLLWPRELQHQRLRMALDKDRTGWIITLVECADRHGLLQSLIRNCLKRSKDEALRHASQLLDAVEHRFKQGAL